MGGDVLCQVSASILPNPLSFKNVRFFDASSFSFFLLKKIQNIKDGRGTLKMDT